MPKQLRSADELVKLILTDPQTWELVQPEQRKEFAKQLQDLAKKAGAEVPPSPPLESDVFIYRMVVAVIGIVVIVALVGAIMASRAGETGNALLTAMVSISSASVGALAGLLSPVSPRR